MATTFRLADFFEMETKELFAPTGETYRPKKLEAPPLRPLRRNGRPAPAKTISVIIPAYNEEAYLHRTLAALRRQSHPAYEVIVVANGCTDRTAEIARGRCDQLITLSQRGLGAARNSGARRAQGELLVFLDADTLLEQDALQIIANTFTRRAAAGTLKGRPDANRLRYRLIYFLKNLIHGSLLHHGSSGVILCWKKQFACLGGFDERLEVRENSDLIKRLERFGVYQYIGRTAATTSMRRYEQRGVWRISWLWTKLWLESFFTDLRHRRYEIVR
jgi:glycosyltransferase involved in cell wall biosynthesis